MTDERQFPIQQARRHGLPTSVPWSVAEVAYEDYSARYGTDQSLERLAERGGFDWTELAYHLHQAFERRRRKLMKP